MSGSQVDQNNGGDADNQGSHHPPLEPFIKDNPGTDGTQHHDRDADGRKQLGTLPSRNAQGPYKAVDRPVVGTPQNEARCHILPPRAVVSF